MKSLSIALVAGLAVLSGCAAFSASSSAYVSSSQLKSIKSGAEKADVIAALGQPANTQKVEGKNVLEYKMSDAVDGTHQIYVYFDANGKYTRYEELSY